MGAADLLGVRLEDDVEDPAVTEYYNPGGNQPEPAALTEEERLEKRRFEAGFVFESTMQIPIRQRSAHGQPPPRTGIERCCMGCGASFLGLAPGKTGERGIWTEGLVWWCSEECWKREAMSRALATENFVARSKETQT
jgi:hypothetical protein